MATPEPKRLFISELICASTIELQLRGRERDEVLTELVAKIPEISDRPAQPARLFFLLVTTTVVQHLAILARISRLVHDRALRQNLTKVDKAEKVIALIREAEAKL